MSEPVMFRAAVLFIIGLCAISCGGEPATEPFSQFASAPESSAAPQTPEAAATLELTASLEPTETAPPPTPVRAETPPAPQPTPTPVAEAASAACSATAIVDNESPTRNTLVTVTGVLDCPGGSPAGAPMTTSWKFKSTTSNCEGVANDAGVANCGRSIGGASVGFRVEITVSFAHEGQVYQAVTGFTTR